MIFYILTLNGKEDYTFLGCPSSFAASYRIENTKRPRKPEPSQTLFLNRDELDE